MRIFNTEAEAEAALGRSLDAALPVYSLADARDMVRALLGPKYEREYSVADTVSAVFIAVHSAHGYTYYLVERGARFWDKAVRAAA